MNDKHKAKELGVDIEVNVEKSRLLAKDTSTFLKTYCSDEKQNPYFHITILIPGLSLLLRGMCEVFGQRHKETKFLKEVATKIINFELDT